MRLFNGLNNLCLSDLGKTFIRHCKYANSQNYVYFYKQFVRLRLGMLYINA